MKKIFFDNLEVLAEFMFRQAEIGLSVSAFLFDEDALQLTKNLLKYDEITPVSLEVSLDYINGYGAEYIVTVVPDLELFVEKAKNDKIYLHSEPDIALVHNEANSKILLAVPREVCKEMYIGKIDSVCMEEEPSSCAFCDDGCWDCEDGCGDDFEDIQVSLDHLLDFLKLASIHIKIEK